MKERQIETMKEIVEDLEEDIEEIMKVLNSIEKKQDFLSFMVKRIKSILKENR